MSQKHAAQVQAELNLANAGYTPIDIAKIAGALEAYAEAGFSVKEASDHAGVPVDVLEHVLLAFGHGA